MSPHTRKYNSSRYSQTLPSCNDASPRAGSITTRWAVDNGLRVTSSALTGFPVSATMLTQERFPTWRHVWEYRELLYFLVWGDIKVRYKQRLLGILRILLQPIISSVVSGTIINRILEITLGEVSFPVTRNFSISARFHKHIKYVLLSISVSLIMTMAIPALAQESNPGENGWSENVLLEDVDGQLPRLVTDRAGRVHALWRSRVDENLNSPASGGEYVIMYRRQENGVWTSAIDILTLPGLERMNLGSVAIDDRDHINLLWFSQGSSRDLFLSRAHSSMAENPRAWTTTLVESPRNAMSDPDIILETDGRIHVAYVLDNNSIVYNRSEDYGDSWTGWSTVWRVVDKAIEAVSGTRIAIDRQSNLHVVWTLNDAERSWQGVAVYYARSTDGGNSWSIEEIHHSEPDEPTAGWINVAVRAQDEIHLAWNRGAGSRDGRYHMWSPDNGITWSDPQSFMPPYVSGQTQWPLMEVDSEDVLHLVTIADWEDQETRPRYTFWDGKSWSPMVTIPESSSDFDSWFTIGLGNQLHLIHPIKRFRSELVYNFLQLPVAGTTPRSISMPSISEPEAQDAPIATVVLTEEADLNFDKLLAGELDSPPSTGLGASVIVIPILAAGLLVGMVFGWQLWSRGKR